MCVYLSTYICASLYKTCMLVYVDVCVYTCHLACLNVTTPRLPHAHTRALQLTSLAVPPGMSSSHHPASSTLHLACQPTNCSLPPVPSSPTGVTTYVRDSLSPLTASADPLEEEEDESEAGICEEGRVLVTDHGSFSLVNVYAPNSGERPERGRLGFKLAFLRALRRKCEGDRCCPG